MIEVHLYGKLRRFTDNQDPSQDSIINIPVNNSDSIESIVRRIGIPFEELGSNIFLNGEYSALERKVSNGDRLGIFPDDMKLLYKWYFNKAS
ncbi:MAG: MoaD/ThiS family protein [Dehalococcoidales bacterium]|nr:MoaD/ThiS family protein [Dehalococcoidales bacterium]